MGVDSFKDVTTWREYERILSGYDVIVAMRPGYPHDRDDRDHRDAEDVVLRLAPDLQAKVVDLRGGRLPSGQSFESPHIYLTDYAEVDVSATTVRETAANGEAIDSFVPPSVAAYIVKYELYRKSEWQKC
jgi:nicotinate-nucleotide adenylyltransferase